MKRITVDLTKASTETLDLTSVLNPRVGDGQLSVPLHIIYGTDDSGNDDPVDMRDKDIEFLSQDTNKNDIYVSGTVTTNSKGDDPYNGNVTFVFPEGTFKVSGTYDVDKTMFRIINKADKIVLSTVNVKLNVLEGGNSDYNFDPNKTSYNSRLEDMLKLAQSQMKDKIANADKEAQAVLTDAKQKSADIIKDASDQAQSLLDGIKQTSDEAKGNVAGDTAATAKQAKQQANDNAGKVHDLQGEVGDARGRFMTLSDRENKQDFNIDRKEDKANANSNYAAINLRDDQQDKAIAEKASQSFITDYLSRMYLQPEGFENEAALKAKYPTGKEGIFVTVDTGHKWIYANGQWNDCGVYQSAGIANGAITTAKTDFALHQNNLYDPAQSRVGIYDIDNGKVVYKDATVNAKYAQLTCFKFKVTNEQRTYTVSGTDFNVFGSLDDGTLAWSDDHSDGVDGPYTFTVPVNVVWVYVTFNTGTYTEYEILPGNLTFDQTGKFMLNAPLASPLADDVVTPEMTNFFYDVSNLYDPDKAKTGIYNVDNNKIVYEDASVNSNYANLTCFKFRIQKDARIYTVPGTSFNVFGSLADGTMAWSDNNVNGVKGPYTFTVPANVVWVYISFITKNYENYSIIPEVKPLKKKRMKLNAILASPLDDHLVTPQMTTFVNEGNDNQLSLDGKLASPLADDVVTPEMTTFITGKKNLYDASQAKAGIYNIQNGKVVFQDSSVNPVFGTLTGFRFKVVNNERTYTVSGTDFNVFGTLDDGTLAWSDNQDNGVTGPYTFTVPENVVWITIAFLTKNYDDYKIAVGNSIDQIGYSISKDIKIDAGENRIDVGNGRTYTKLIDAIKAIKPDKDHVYNIYIHDNSSDYTGTTYDLLAELGGEDYLKTIENASDNMQGFHIPAYVNLIGVGRVTLQAELPDTATLNQSTNFSTIELEQGNNKLSNLTIKVKNGRYPVHDESRDKYPNAYHEFDNVTFIHEGNKSGLWDSPSAYGAGISGGCTYTYHNCTFDASKSDGYPFGLHNYAPQLGSTINIDGAQMIVNANRPEAIHLGFNGFSPITTDANKYAACYTDVYIKDVLSDGSILVEPEVDKYSCTNNYRIHNFTSLKLDVKDNYIKQ